MSQKAKFHNLQRPDFHELAAGVTTRIFAGEQAMLSVVTIAPHASGTLHHPARGLGRAPGGAPHTMRAARTAPACSTSSHRRGCAVDYRAH